MAVGLAPLRRRPTNVSPALSGMTLNSLQAPPPAALPPAVGAAPPEGASGGPRTLASVGLGNALGGGFSARNLTRQQLQAGAKAGAFSPEYLRRFLLRRALLNRAAARRRAAAAAGLYSYGDPYAARSAAVNSEIGSAGDFSNELSNADLAAYGGFQDYLRGQLNSERGYEDAAAQRAAEERAAAAGNLGQLAGYAGGKVLDRILK